MDIWRLASFALVWIALAIYTFSALQADRAKRFAADEEPATL